MVIGKLESLNFFKPKNVDRIFDLPYTEGTLFIDFIYKNKNELIWQGIGSGAMQMSSIEKREERINEFVSKIIATYPPGLNKK